MTDAAVVERDARSMTRLRTLTLLQEHGVYLALVAIVLFNLGFTDNWLTAASMKQQLADVAPVVIVALGMAIVIGTEGIDLSVGATMAIAASVIGQMLGHGATVWAIVPAVIIVGCAVGAVGGTLVAFFEVQPIVATLALLIAGRGLAILIQAPSLSLSDEAVSAFGLGTWLGLQAPIWDAVVPVLVIAFVVRRSVLGRRIVAIGDNVRAAYLSGVPVRGTLLTVYMVSGALAAFAGFVVTARTTTTDPTTNGVGYELLAITAVVVGGTPLSGGRIRVVGTIAGALVMWFLRSTLVFHNISNAVSQMAVAVIIIVAVLVQRKRGRA